MNEQHPRRSDGPWSEGGYGDRDRSAGPDYWQPDHWQPDHWQPTEQLPTARYRAEPQPYTRPAEPQPYTRPAEPQPYTRPAEPQPFARPAEPLAHEGGFPYGMPPAVPHAAPMPYGYGDPYLPAHLHVPPQQFQQGPYPQHFGYPPLQQTVYVHGAPATRVNHALHLVLTIVTFGLWLPVWIILAIANS